MADEFDQATRSDATAEENNPKLPRAGQIAMCVVLPFGAIGVAVLA